MSAQVAPSLFPFYGHCGEETRSLTALCPCSVGVFGGAGGNQDPKSYLFVFKGRPGLCSFARKLVSLTAVPSFASVSAGSDPFHDGGR